MNKEKIVLCLGAGVNSTALVVLHAQGKIEFDCAVFADTGGEHPETYGYLKNVLIPYAEKHGLKIEIVRSEKPPLYDFYLQKKIIPTRMFRHCTDHYKIRPIKKFLLNHFQNSQIVLAIGIDAGEKHRAKESCGFTYPLVEMGIDREACKKIIEDANLPLPHKSGCYFCPFTTKKGWLTLLTNHSDLFLKAEVLEKNCMHYPELTLTNISLEKLRKDKEAQKQLCDYLNDCAMCEVES